MRARSLLAVAVVGLAAVLLAAGCGGTSAPGAPVSATPAVDAVRYPGPVGEGEGRVSILAWPGYVEDGSTDPAVDWVTDFEKVTGCTVNLRLLSTSAEAVQLMQAGGWDVISASGDVTLRLIHEGSVQPVNTELVPNYADIHADLKLRSFNSVKGIPYGIPHGRGANLLMWDTRDVSPAPDSWAATFESDSPYRGFVTAYDAPIAIADAAVYLMATRPELGIQDPYALDRTQFDAVIALLKQQRELIGDYWQDYADEIAAFTAGTSTIGSSWQSIVGLAEAEGVPVEAIKPKEGTTGWSDTWMIATDARNINCAYLWLDHIVSPEVNAQVAEWVGQAPANRKSCGVMADKTHCATFHAGDTPYWADVYYWSTPMAECIDGRTDVRCVPYSEWAAAWSRLRGQRP